MNSKLKSLVAVVALGAAGAANAGITSGQGGANGELFLTIWDPTAGNEASFTIGLNIFTNTFNPNGTYSFTNIFSDPVFQQFFGASSFGGANADISKYRWNIVAASDLSDQSRVLFTETSSNLVLNNAATDNAATATSNFLAALGSTCDSCGTDVKASPKYAGDNWGSDFNGNAATASNAAAVGTSLNFYQAVDNIAASDYNNTGLDPATMTKFAYTWLLDASGTLTYGPAVPIPAALWLLTSGLIGFAGVGRRRSANVATA